MVLILDDDEVTKSPFMTEKGTTYRKLDSFGKTAEGIFSYLNTIGFTPAIESFAVSNSMNWDNYDLIILAAGLNGQPAKIDSQRAKIVDYVKNGGKILIEGGEVGFNYRADKDVDFRNNVLHIVGWTGDNNSGDLILQDASHPIATNPHQIPAQISFSTQTNWFDKDALSLAKDAYYVFDYSEKPGKSGVIVYDRFENNFIKPQIVFFSFNLTSITLQNTWHNLLENGLEYLLHWDQEVPVEFLNFTSQVDERSIILSWETATETNNGGFSIERKNGSSKFAETGFVKGKGNSTGKSSYVYVDEVSLPGVYTYRLKQIDFDGSFHLSNEITVNVGIPDNFVLKQNFPNPFNSSTNIRYLLPKDCFVNLSVYNLLGEKIAVLLEDYMEAGSHEVIFESSNLASGIYIYKLEAFSSGSNKANFVQTRKMLIIK